MPGIIGLELQAELNRRGVVLPVVMITAHADVPVAIRAMREGAYEFIQKPVDSRHLLDVVRRAFDVSVARLRDQAEHDSIRQRYESLIARAEQLLEAMVYSRLSNQLAYDRGIHPPTTEVHQANDTAQ